MADISSYLKKILEAIYGEEVRGSIHDALAAMNKESSSAMEFAATANQRLPQRFRHPDSKRSRVGALPLRILWQYYNLCPG